MTEIGEQLLRNQIVILEELGRRGCSPEARNRLRAAIVASERLITEEVRTQVRRERDLRWTDRICATIRTLTGQPA